MGLQKLTGDLSVMIANIRTRNGYESEYMDANIHPFLIKHNDIGFFDTVTARNKSYAIDAFIEYEKGDEIFPFHFYKPEVFDKIESVNMVGSYQMICYGASTKQYADYQKLNAQLLEELRKEYNLK
jgi:hypothetical protein